MRNILCTTAYSLDFPVKIILQVQLIFSLRHALNHSSYVRKESISIHFCKCSDNIIQKNSDINCLEINLIGVLQLSSKALDSRVMMDIYSIILEIRTKHLSISHFLQCFLLKEREQFWHLVTAEIESHKQFNLLE